VSKKVSEYSSSEYSGKTIDLLSHLCGAIMAPMMKMIQIVVDTLDGRMNELEYAIIQSAASGDLS